MIIAFCLSSFVQSLEVLVFDSISINLSSKQILDFFFFFALTFNRLEKLVVRLANATPDWVAKVVLQTEIPGQVVPGSNLLTRLQRFSIFQVLVLLVFFTCGFDDWIGKCMSF